MGRADILSNACHHNLCMSLNTEGIKLILENYDAAPLPQGQLSTDYSQQTPHSSDVCFVSSKWYISSALIVGNPYINKI